MQSRFRFSLASSRLWKALSTSPQSALFLGSDEFSSKVLRSVHLRKIFPSIKVVCPSSGQRVHNKKVANKFRREAKELNLPTIDWKGNDSLLLDDVENIDMAIVASFGHKLSKSLIEKFPYGIINIHPSLLPRWRGAAPLQHTIMSGDAKTGVSLVKIEDEKFDRGRILIQKSIEIDSEVTYAKLRDTLALMGSELLIEIMGNFDWFSANAKTQENKAGTLAKKISKEAGFIDFDDSILIDRKFRALGHDPGIYVQRNETRIKLTSLSHVPDDETCPECAELTAGESLHRRDWNWIYTKCNKGGLRIEKIQMPFKAPVSAKDFANAYMQRISNQWKSVKFYPIQTNCY